MAWHGTGLIRILSPPTGMIFCASPGHSKWEPSMPRRSCRHYSVEDTQRHWDEPLRSSAGFQKPFIYSTILTTNTIADAFCMLAGIKDIPQKFPLCQTL